MQFSSTYINPQSSLMYKGILVPDEIMTEIKKMENQRFLITINDQETFPGTTIPVEKEVYIILINNERAKKLKLNFGDTATVKLVPDESKYGMPIPEEFAEVLYNDPEGQTYFEKLTPGKIRSLIHIVAKLKSEEKRIEKSVVILEHLRINKGKLDFKMLNQAFKDYNKR